MIDKLIYWLLILKYYFDKDLPRDEDHFKLRITNAKCYLDWDIEDGKVRV